MTPTELITLQFPNLVLIPLTAAGAAIGLAKQTSYNMRHKGVFPLPVRMVGTKPMVALTDLANYLEFGSVVVTSNDVEVEPKRRTGRPTKRETVERMRKLA